MVRRARALASAGAARGSAAPDGEVGAHRGTGHRHPDAASTDHACGGAPRTPARQKNHFWPASACIKSPRPRSFFHLTFDESEKVGVDPLRIDDCDTVSATLVDFQDRVRNDRWYAAASRTDRHDLIVFAVYDE